MRLVDHVAQSLAAQTAALVICGREEPGLHSLDDRPESGLGPLGGLNAALHHARAHGFDAVLSAGCDVPNLPRDLVTTLAGKGAAIVQSQPVVGLWPAPLHGTLDGFIAEGGRALYGFAERVDARRVRYDPPLININRPEDLPGKSGD